MSRKKKEPNFSDKIEQDSSLQWRVHTPGLLKEIAENTREGWAVQIPLRIFAEILAEVGQRAAELNDDKLNALMCRLTIYSIADPSSEDYDKDLTNQIIEKGRK